jgi:molybdopterin-guanine dinucleotide biosynthesis protein A
MGVPKALLSGADGLTILEHVVHTARCAGCDVVLVGHGGGLPEPLRTLDILDDDPAGSGPLAGLCALLARARPGPALLLSCDLPLLTPALLATLLSAAQDPDDAVLFRHRAPAPSFHTCCAYYHSRTLERARRALQAGRHSLQELIRELARVRVLEPDAGAERALTNVNTPADLAACGMSLPQPGPQPP